jgi:hypothetical protein
MRASIIETNGVKDMKDKEAELVAEKILNKFIKPFKELTISFIIGLSIMFIFYGVTEIEKYNWFLAYLFFVFILYGACVFGKNTD